jgi:tetratricopeptide (TPR) repeat protein
MTQAQEAAWSHAIELSPENAAAWGNRGSVRLQAGRWAAAYDDLATAARLEQAALGMPSAITLNSLGNAEGALGRWQDALQHYANAQDDADMGEIAAANYALAAWQLGDDARAVSAARRLLRRDPEFLDVRAALTAFLWGSGERAAAEEEWEQLQASAADGLGAALYSRTAALDRVRPRWPPRATAALAAFLQLSDEGSAQDYDGGTVQYTFAVR